jgi:hypothetical protein
MKRKPYLGDPLDYRVHKVVTLLEFFFRVGGLALCLLRPGGREAP